jgi:phosphoglucomutase
MAQAPLMDRKTLTETLKAAVASGGILKSSFKNIRPFLTARWLPAWAQLTLAELITSHNDAELNDRFFKENEFGTAGIRGRTIRPMTPAPEAGTRDALGAPEHAAVGSATLNDFNVIRTTVGLYRYCEKSLAGNRLNDVPKLVVAHDVRHFSRHFAELVASTWTALGGRALLFDGPRSTPQLSFTVRYARATAGVVITASHNPAHDNGYKVYFSDGGQIVRENDAGIIAAVNATPFKAVKAFLKKDISKVVALGKAEDEAYLEALRGTLIQPELLKKFPPRLVYSPVHGTGSVAILPALERYTGTPPVVVAQQLAFDGRFPTVKSPNPQNPETLAMAMKLADERGINVVLATDPDDDRMGAAVKGPEGWQVLTGNTIGSLIAEDRLSHMKELGILPQAGHPRATLIKTFVTTPLQDAIAAAHGVRCVNTLTGFKWIGAKLARYEKELTNALAQKGVAVDYDACSTEIRRAWALEHGQFYVFGGEESYGYLGTDCVRDKDGNAAVLMFAELLARWSAKGKTLLDALDALHLKYGAYAEGALSVTFEGAEGAEKLKRLLASYAKNPPHEIAGHKVLSIRDFAREDITDPDGEVVPKAAVLFFELADGLTVAIRPSGTEPNIRAYCFAHASVANAEALKATRQKVNSELEALKAALKADMEAR